jgi:hypothetical protein
MTPHHTLPNQPSVAADLLHVLDRELTSGDLDALPDADLSRLNILLFHWQSLANMRLERRRQPTQEAQA